MRRGTFTFVGLMAVVLLAAGLYVNTLPNDFVNDDIEVVVTNTAAQHLDLGTIFGTPSWWGRFRNGYRPLATLSYAINHAVSGPRPTAYHATNGFLHALVGVLVFLLLRRLSGAEWPALLAALLFVAHPIDTEAVATVSGRAEILAALAVLVALYADVLSYESGPGARRWGARAATVGALAAALLSNENAVTAVLLLAVTDWWLRCRGSWSKFVAGLRGSRGLLYGALLLVAAVYGGWRVHVEGGASPVNAAMNPLLQESLGVRLINAVAIVGRYLFLLVVPWHLSADYMIGTLPVLHSPWSAPVLSGALALLAVIAIAVVSARRAPLVTWGVLFAACTYGVVANIAFPAPAMMAERWMYLPAIGFCVAVVFGVTALVRSVELPVLRTVSAGVALLVLAGLGIRTIVRNRDWHDQERVWRATVQVFPDSFRANEGLANVYLEQRRWADAIPLLQAATRVYQGEPRPYEELAIASAATGDTDGAIKAYEKAVALAPKAVPLRRRLANLYVSKRDYSGAIRHLRAVADQMPQSAQVWADLGEVYYVAQVLGDAETMFRKALALDPNLPKPHIGLAAFLQSQGNYEEARDEYLKGLSLGARPTPQLRGAIVSLLQDHAKIGQVSAADSARVAQEVLRYFPNSPDLQALAEKKG